MVGLGHCCEVGNWLNTRLTFVSLFFVFLASSTTVNLFYTAGDCEHSSPRFFFLFLFTCKLLIAEDEWNKREMRKREETICVFVYCVWVLPVGCYGFTQVDKNQYPHPIQPFSHISLVRDIWSGYFVPLIVFFCLLLLLVDVTALKPPE